MNRISPFAALLAPTLDHLQRLAQAFWTTAQRHSRVRQTKARFDPEKRNRRNHTARLSRARNRR